MSEQNDKVSQSNPLDPTVNVKGLIEDLAKRLDEKIADKDEKYQVQFTSSKEAAAQRFEAQQLALKDALIAQEKAVAAALEGTKEAINKADVATDKRFGLLSEKIDGVVETTSRNTGERGVYVTHSDLNVSLEKLQTNIETMIRPVITFMNTQGGKSSGLNMGWIYLIGAISLFGTVISIFHALSN